MLIAAKADDLSSIPATHMVEEDSSKLSLIFPQVAKKQKRQGGDLGYGNQRFCLLIYLVALET